MSILARLSLTACAVPASRSRASACYRPASFAKLWNALATTVSMTGHHMARTDKGRMISPAMAKREFQCDCRS